MQRRKIGWIVAIAILGGVAFALVCREAIPMIRITIRSDAQGLTYSIANAKLGHDRARLVQYMRKAAVLSKGPFEIHVGPTTPFDAVADLVHELKAGDADAVYFITYHSTGGPRRVFYDASVARDDQVEWVVTYEVADETNCITSRPTVPATSAGQ
jgi:hypothetical protein